MNGDDIAMMRDLGYHEMADMIEKQRGYHDDLVHRRQAGEVEREDWCACSDEYWLRGLEDPYCRHDEVGLRQAQIDALRAEVDRLRAVVDAAIAWCEPFGIAPNASQQLRDAVTAYCTHHTPEDA